MQNHLLALPACLLVAACSYTPEPHAPYSGEDYAPAQTEQLISLERGYARHAQGLPSDDDVKFLRTMTGEHLKIEGNLFHQRHDDPGAFGIRMLISPADKPDHKIVIHRRRFGTPGVADDMGAYLSTTPDVGTAYVRVHMDMAEGDPFDLHAIGLTDGSFLSY